MHHKNEKYRIMGPKLSGQPMRVKKYPPIRRQKIYTKRVEIFIYYVRAVDLIMLLALGSLAVEKSKLIEDNK